MEGTPRYLGHVDRVKYRKVALLESGIAPHSSHRPRLSRRASYGKDQRRGTSHGLRLLLVIQSTRRNVGPVILKLNFFIEGLV